MKIVLLGHEPVDYTVSFVNGLAGQADVTAILARDRYERLGDWISPAADVRLVDWPRHRSLSNIPFLARLTGMIRAERPDVIHLLSNTVTWLNAAVPFWRPVPLVTTIHDVTAHPGDHDTRRLPDWPAQLVARQSDDLVVHGEGLRKAAARRFGKPASRVHVLQHPAITRYAELARREGVHAPEPRAGRFRVLLFGRIFAYKGLSTLIRAEALLADTLPGLEIAIAGRGDDPAALRPLMGRPERYDIRHRFIEDREVAELFLGADLVVLPYDEASQSGVLHLAATFGKPVLVTDVGELRETVIPNGLGLVVPPGDPAALAGAIRGIAEDRPRRAALGRTARAWSEGRNAPSTIGREAIAMYRQITSTGLEPCPN